MRRMSKSTVVRWARVRWLFAGLAAILGSTALAVDTGTLRKVSSLRGEPFRDAKSVVALAPGDSVEIITMQGGWYRVRSAKGRGWVRMLDVRRGKVREGGIDSNELRTLASGRTGTGRMVASTGIRGLDEEHLKAAPVSEAQLTLLDAQMVTPADAAQQAARYGLVPRSVE